MKYAYLLLGFGLATSLLAAQDLSEPPPNIVFFLVDDLGWRDLGCQGSSYYESPQIDRLAAEGVRFTQAYANAPNCAPSRACLMTGQWTPRHGVFTVGSADRGPGQHRRLATPKNKTALDRSFVTLPEMLKERGYATAAIGKWHLGAGPEAQGFDVNVAGNRAGTPYGGYFSPYKNRNLSDGPRGEYLTDRLTDEALAFVESHRAQPFFLYLSHFGVHTPIQAKEESRAHFAEKKGSAGHDNPTYAGMIQSVDESLGRLRAKLAELKLAENTVIVFFSDNGGHGPVTSMKPLRGAKGMLYEGGIRVPLIVKVPGLTPRGKVSARPVSGIDLVPTLLDLAGVPTAKRAALDGESLVAHLRAPEAVTPKAKPRALYWHFPAYLQATGRSSERWRTTPASAIRWGDWKLIHFFEDDRRELFNLATDLGESTNLAAEEPKIASELYGRLEAWRLRTKAPRPPGLNSEWVDPARLKAARQRRPAPRTQRRQGEKPNIVLILADDWGWAELGANGERPGGSLTPTIDRLAAEGLRARAAYAGGAVGPSSRCVLLTGRQGGYAYLRGRLDRGDRRALSLPAPEVTVAEQLREAGYTTAWFGRWGLCEPGTPGLPNLQGFDRFLGSLEPRRRGRRAGAPVFARDLDPIQAPASIQARDELALQAALQFLSERRDDEPFLLVFAPEGLRSTSTPPKPQARVQALKRFDGEVGRLVAAVDARADAAQTLLVVTADQGASAREPHANDPWRGGKGELTEGALRVPFVARWSGEIGAGRVLEQPISLADLSLTLARLAGRSGAAASPAPAATGRDLAAIFRGASESGLADRVLYWEHAQRMQALRRGPWKLVRAHPRSPFELYHLQKDPGEARSVAREEPALVAELGALMERCRTRSELFPLVR
jgi:arylsulfatase A-like enzyme